MVKLVTKLKSAARESTASPEEKLTKTVHLPLFLLSLAWSNNAARESFSATSGMWRQNATLAVLNKQLPQ